MKYSRVVSIINARGFFAQAMPLRNWDIRFLPQHWLRLPVALMQRSR